MGVFLADIISLLNKEGLPHARGGVSIERRWVADMRRSSPRPWGCFFQSNFQTPGSKVFPTPVGVFPDARSCSQCWPGLPHARGGVSKKACLFRQASWVFPTPVGVFPCMQAAQQASSGLPHARGGVSQGMFHGMRQALSSPRPWGCFSAWRKVGAWTTVFPTPVGVFRQHRRSHSLL